MLVVGKLLVLQYSLCTFIHIVRHLLGGHHLISLCVQSGHSRGDISPWLYSLGQQNRRRLQQALQKVKQVINRPSNML